MFKMIFAAILGGIIFFAWNSVSWMVLPWHQQTISHFDNDQVVMEALSANANPEKGGIYLLPKMDHKTKGSNLDEASAEIERTESEKSLKPFAFISYKPQGSGRSMEDSMKFALINSIFVSILIVILLSGTSDLGYLSRVFFIVMIGFVGALLGHVPNWIWWGFDGGYTLVMIADTLIGWFLAGLGIAALVGHEPDYLSPD